MSKESIDLNICQRGLGETKWTARLGVITKENLDKVKDQRTDNTSAQNALPTPFARFFLMEDAFRIVTSARKDGVEAGLSYRRMVSDCLDVFELLYNWQYHENHRKDESYRLAFRVWGEEEADVLGLVLQEFESVVIESRSEQDFNELALEEFGCF